MLADKTFSWKILILKNAFYLYADTENAYYRSCSGGYLFSFTFKVSDKSIILSGNKRY